MKTLLSIILLLILSGSIFGQKQVEVIVPLTYIRILPNSAAETLQVVRKGEQVTLLNKKKQGWLYVSVLDGRLIGWINANTLKIDKRKQN